MEQWINRPENISDGGKEADLKTKNFHLHHLHLQVLLNVYAWGEGEGGRVDLGGSTLLVGEPSAINSRGDWTLVDSVGNVNVLDLGVVVKVEFLLNRLVAGVGCKTGEIEGSTRSSCVGHVGGSGADTAGAKAREEGSAVVLLR